MIFLLIFWPRKGFQLCLQHQRSFLLSLGQKNELPLVSATNCKSSTSLPTSDEVPGRTGEWCCPEVSRPILYLRVISNRAKLSPFRTAPWFPPHRPSALELTAPHRRGAPAQPSAARRSVAPPSSPSRCLTQQPCAGCIRPFLSQFKHLLPDHPNIDLKGLWGRLGKRIWMLQMWTQSTARNTWRTETSRDPLHSANAEFSAAFATVV